MTTVKSKLHTLIDMTDDRESPILFQILLKFIPQDIATSDEIQAITEGREQFKNGEYYSQSEVNSLLNI